MNVDLLIFFLNLQPPIPDTNFICFLDKLDLHDQF